MVALKVYTMEGVEKDAIDVSEKVFNHDTSETLVHDVIVGMQAALRQGTHATKTRSKVSGGGAKPFRQKGTGRARRGSSRDPILRGGGTVFGPVPRNYRNNITTAMKRKALCALLTARTRSERLRVLADYKIEQPKTREFAQMLDKVATNSRRTLFVTADYDENTLLSSRNIPNVYVRTAMDVSPLDVIRASSVLVQQEALPKLEERLS
ncbi:MAG: 50S ribosomal protein L4 [Candidatus Hydrogenedentales bacterium]|jgi:large subunit ribosomal protein L4